MRRAAHFIVEIWRVCVLGRLQTVKPNLLCVGLQRRLQASSHNYSSSVKAIAHVWTEILM